MNRLLFRRREALIAQAADQRRQLAYAFSGITHRLRFVDRGIGWLVRRKYATLLTLVVLGAGLVMRRHGKLAKLAGIAMIALHAIQASLKVISVLRAARRSGNPHNTVRRVDLGQRISRWTN